MSNQKNLICKRLKEIRRKQFGERGMSRFSKALGVNPSTYNRYEADRTPPAEILAKAAKLTNTPLEWLLGGELPPTSLLTEENLRLLRSFESIRKRDPKLHSILEQLCEAILSAESGDPKVVGKGKKSRSISEAVASQPRPQQSGPETLSASKSAIEAFLPDVAGALIPILGSTSAGMARFWSETPWQTEGPLADQRISSLLEQQAHRLQRLESGLRTDDEDLGPMIVSYSEPDQSGVIEFVSAQQIRNQYPDAVAWRIDGDSMSPRYLEGDLIITSASVPAVNGHPCVARQSGQIGLNCKIFQRSGDQIILSPLNREYPSQKIAAEELEWAHRVLFSIRPQLPGKISAE